MEKMRSSDVPLVHEYKNEAIFYHRPVFILPRTIIYKKNEPVFLPLTSFYSCPGQSSSIWRISTRSDRDQPTTQVFEDQWLVQISCNARWHFLKIIYFLLFIHIFVLSALCERGRWRCRGSTSTSSTSSSAATLWESFQTPGRLSTGEITVSCELLPKKLWVSRWECFTPRANLF